MKGVYQSDGMNPETCHRILKNGFYGSSSKIGGSLASNFKLLPQKIWSRCFLLFTSVIQEIEKY